MPEQTSHLTELAEEVIAFRDERDWKQFHKTKDLFLSLLLEAGELAELAQWRDGEELEQYLGQNRERLEDELADVFYWVLLIANTHDIDLAKSLRSKLAKNAEKYPVNLSRGRKEKYSELQ